MSKHMTKHIIVTESLFRFGIKHFGSEVNAMLAKGWDLQELRFEKVGLLRVLCIAVLAKAD